MNASGNGIVEDACFPYPEESGEDPDYYFGECDSMQSCTEDASFPGYDIHTNVSNNTDLKRLIIDNDPVMAALPNIGLPLYGGMQGSHTLLIIGWRNVNGVHNWILKDSWPGDAKIWETSFNIVNYTGDAGKFFFTVKYTVGAAKISCNEFSESDRVYEDVDSDGFYYWGIEPKPVNCPGPCQMDFNDKDPTKICLDEYYEEQETPYVTVIGSDYVCQSGSYFRFHELPDGFSAPEWEVTPTLYFNGPTSGTGTLVLVTPKSEYIGKECTISFTISDNCGSAEYSKDFVINGPEEDLISIEVEDSYGGTPSKYGDIWLLCPSTTIICTSIITAAVQLPTMTGYFQVHGQNIIHIAIMF